MYQKLIWDEFHRTFDHSNDQLFDEYIFQFNRFNLFLLLTLYSFTSINHPYLKIL